MKYTLILVINYYQRYISPYKGFHCAYANQYGGDSCSQAIKRILLNEGCIKSFHFSRSRFRNCRNANETLRRGNKLGSCDCLGEGTGQCAENCISNQISSVCDSFDCCSF